ncbi:MAG: Rieske 2Fe-2S domain-containing protein [Chloroflexi bacterium]|nr:Rieske 2Fe-2S domain-containing protein [Chloroflexota bacterium]MBT7290357.1 Rieske 2Fe-2S domain-containing protein [Chloroflexota bacterium]
MQAVTLNGQEILIAQVRNKYYAVRNICPHRGGRLSEGTLTGMVVECPLHGSQFNIVNGQPVRWLRGGLSGKIVSIIKALSRSKKFQTYKTHIEDDSIMVEM